MDIPHIISMYSCPPRSFIPALCKIFLDEEAPDNVLEVTARALTYYLDVSVECSRRITTVDGALKAIIARMYAADMDTRMSKDLVEQSVKVCGKALYWLHCVSSPPPPQCTTMHNTHTTTLFSPVFSVSFHGPYSGYSSHEMKGSLCRQFDHISDQFM